MSQEIYPHTKKKETLMKPLKSAKESASSSNRRESIYIKRLETGMNIKQNNPSLAGKTRSLRTHISRTHAQSTKTGINQEISQKNATKNKKSKPSVVTVKHDSENTKQIISLSQYYGRKTHDDALKSKSLKELSSPKLKSTTGRNNSRAGRCSLRESSLPPRPKTTNKKSSPSSNSKKLPSPKLKSHTDRGTTSAGRHSLRESSLPLRPKNTSKKRSPPLLKKVEKVTMKEQSSPTRSLPSTPTKKPLPHQMRSSVKKDKTVKIATSDSDDTEHGDCIRTSFRKTPAPLGSLQDFVSVKSPVSRKKKCVVVLTLPSMTPKPQEPSDILKENLKKNVASELKTLSMNDSGVSPLGTPRKRHDECTGTSESSFRESPVSCSLFTTPVSSRKSSLTLRESNGKRRSRSPPEESFNGTPLKWKKKSEFESHSSYFTSVSKETPVRMISHSGKNEYDVLPSLDNNFAPELEESSIEEEIISDDLVTSSKNSAKWRYCVLM